MEKVSNKENGLFNYQNYASNGFLGYDPNGDYIYTKGQAYGAEQWQLRSDESATDGHRQIVIYADYGKKYLAIVNGKLTGVSNPNSDCLWIVEWQHLISAFTIKDIQTFVFSLVIRSTCLYYL